MEEGGRDQPVFFVSKRPLGMVGQAWKHLGETERICLWDVAIVIVTLGYYGVVPHRKRVRGLK